MDIVQQSTETTYTRNCPQCGEVLEYTGPRAKRSFSAAEKKGSLCISCGNSKPELKGPFYRDCAGCGKVMEYKGYKGVTAGYSYHLAEKKVQSCTSCRRKGIKHTQKTKDKIGAKSIGRRKGIKHTQKTKNVIIARLINYRKNNITAGTRCSWMRGYMTHSPNKQTKNIYQDFAPILSLVF